MVQPGSAPFIAMESEVCTFPKVMLRRVSWFFHNKEKLLVLLFFYRIFTSNWSMDFTVQSYVNGNKCSCSYVLFYLQLHDEFCAETSELYKMQPFSSIRYCMQKNRRKLNVYWGEGVWNYWNHFNPNCFLAALARL